MDGRFFLDIVVSESSVGVKLFAGKDKSLLVSWDALFVLELSLHGSNSVWLFNVEGKSFASECANEDLHSTSKS